MVNNMKENPNSAGSKQELVEWFKCNECGRFFHYKHMQITNYQEYPGAALSVEYSSPCCNSMDIEQVQDQELTETSVLEAAA